MIYALPLSIITLIYYKPFDIKLPLNYTEKRLSQDSVDINDNRNSSGHIGIMEQSIIEDGSRMRDKGNNRDDIFSNAANDVMNSSDSDAVRNEYKIYNCVLNTLKYHTKQLQLPLEASEFYSKCTECW